MSVSPGGWAALASCRLGGIASLASNPHPHAVTQSHFLPFRLELLPHPPTDPCFSNHLGNPPQLLPLTRPHPTPTPGPDQPRGPGSGPLAGRPHGAGGQDGAHRPRRLHAAGAALAGRQAAATGAAGAAAGAAGHMPRHTAAAAAAELGSSSGRRSGGGGGAQWAAGVAVLHRLGCRGFARRRVRRYQEVARSTRAVQRGEQQREVPRSRNRLGCGRCRCRCSRRRGRGRG